MEENKNNHDCPKSNSKPLWRAQYNTTLRKSIISQMMSALMKYLSKSYQPEALLRVAKHLESKAFSNANSQDDYRSIIRVNILRTINTLRDRNIPAGTSNTSNSDPMRQATSADESFRLPSNSQASWGVVSGSLVTERKQPDVSSVTQIHQVLDHSQHQLANHQLLKQNEQSSCAALQINVGDMEGINDVNNSQQKQVVEQIGQVRWVSSAKRQIEQEAPQQMSHSSVPVTKASSELPNIAGGLAQQSLRMATTQPNNKSMEPQSGHSLQHIGGEASSSPNIQQTDPIEQANMAQYHKQAFQKLKSLRDRFYPLLKELYGMLSSELQKTTDQVMIANYRRKMVKLKRVFEFFMYNENDIARFSKAMFDNLQDWVFDVVKYHSEMKSSITHEAAPQHNPSDGQSSHVFQMQQTNPQVSQVQRVSPKQLSYMQQKNPQVSQMQRASPTQVSYMQRASPTQASLMQRARTTQASYMHMQQARMSEASPMQVVSPSQGSPLQRAGPSHSSPLQQTCPSQDCRMKQTGARVIQASSNNSTFTTSSCSSLPPSSVQQGTLISQQVLPSSPAPPLPSPGPALTETSISTSTPLIPFATEPAGNLQHKQLTIRRIKADSTIAILEEPVAATSSANLDDNQQKASTMDPFQGLLKAVKSSSPKSLRAGVSEMSSVMNIFDRMAGTDSHTSTGPIGEDLSYQARRNLEGGQFSLQDIGYIDVSSPGNMNQSASDMSGLSESTATSRFKRQKIEKPTSALLDNIRKINSLMVETVINLEGNQDNATHNAVKGTIVRCNYHALAFTEELLRQCAPQLLPVLTLRLFVAADYPNSSPIVLGVLNGTLSEQEATTELIAEVRVTFDRWLRQLSEPMSLVEIAERWDACVSQVYWEFAEQVGGECFSSKYGRWEKLA